MTTLQMLDVAIGIIFIYLLLSLICTALNEIIEGFLKKRASDLERGIRELLQDYVKDDGENVNEKLKEIYTHPLVAGLYRGTYKPNNKCLPSYIPASNFALALMDIILPASANNLSGSAGGGAIGTNAKSLRPLRDALNAWDDNTTPKKALLTLIDAAGNDINKARQNIENWYNTSMDRVSGWYKRRLQFILLGLGFAVASIMNADSIAIFKSLMNDTPVRNMLVASAQDYTSSHDNAIAKGTPAVVIDSTAKKLNSLRLPIGWDWHIKDLSAGDQYRRNYYLALPWEKVSSVNNSGDFLICVLLILLKIVGLTLTGLAVSLGAPFWFDVLNKFMVIRSTVKPHEKSLEEDSEDRQTKKS